MIRNENNKILKDMELRSAYARKNFKDLVDKMDGDTSKALAEFLCSSGSRKEEINWLKSE